MYKNIYLKKGKEESLKRFHPWVFSGAISHIDDGIEEGDIVKVISSDGGFIAVGHSDRKHCRQGVVVSRHRNRRRFLVRASVFGPENASKHRNSR